MVEDGCIFVSKIDTEFWIFLCPPSLKAERKPTVKHTVSDDVSESRVSRHTLRAISVTRTPVEVIDTYAQTHTAVYDGALCMSGQCETDGTFLTSSEQKKRRRYFNL